VDSATSLDVNVFRYVVLFFGSVIHRVRKKMELLYFSIFAPDFVKCWPIFAILSPADLAVNFQ